MDPHRLNSAIFAVVKIEIQFRSVFYPIGRQRKNEYLVVVYCVSINIWPLFVEKDAFLKNVYIYTVLE